MKKWRSHIAFCLLPMFFFLLGCKKPEMNTRKFMDHGRWGVTQLEIGSTSFSMFPKWEIQQSSDSRAFTPGTWIHDDGTQAAFCWKFDQYSGKFNIMINKSVEQTIEQKAYQQCNNLSGEYLVVTDKRNLFEFQSTETLGYPGTNVFIQLKPL
jgi:hypothetical protein